LLFCGFQFGLTPAREALPRALEALRKSLELDEHCGDAHALLGICRGMLDYDWTGADSSFRRALELSPGSAPILIQHAWFHLVPRLRIVEAVEEAQRAIVLDPLSPLVRGRFGLVLVAARRYGDAARECRAALELAPGLWPLHWFYATALVLLGKQDQGFRHARKAYDLIHPPLAAGGLALLYGLSRRPKMARQLLAELEETSRAVSVPPLALALAYVGVGDDRAFEWFNGAIAERDPVVTHLPSMPLYDGIRSDPRFHALLARMHLA
jgi:Flp pilus assembly protein TadD